MNNKNPLFDVKCNHLLVAFLTASDVEKITVNEEDIPLTQGSYIKKFEKLYMLQEGKQKFEFFMIPSSKVADKYTCKYVKFRARRYINKTKPIYEYK